MQTSFHRQYFKKRINQHDKECIYAVNGCEEYLQCGCLLYKSHESSYINSNSTD